MDSLPAVDDWGLCCGKKNSIIEGALRFSFPDLHTMYNSTLRFSFPDLHTMYNSTLRFSFPDVYIRIKYGNLYLTTYTLHAVIYLTMKVAAVLVLASSALADTLEGQTSEGLLNIKLKE